MPDGTRRSWPSWLDVALYDWITLTATEPETPPSDDHATAELLDLARAGDRAGFQDLASALMPLDEIEPCWAGARARLGLLPVAEGPEWARCPFCCQATFRVDLLPTGRLIGRQQ